MSETPPDQKPVSTKDKFKALLKTRRMGKFAKTSATEYGRGVEWVSDPKEAEVVTSLPAGKMPRPGEEGDDIRHLFMVDIDHPCFLVPSTTEGHHHLYIDVPGGVRQREFFDLMGAMAHAGIVEPGYVEASMDQGHASLRPPWVKKERTNG